MGLTIRLDGELDEAALLRACAAVLARHPVLAMAVDDSGETPCLVPAAVPPPVVRAPLTDTLVADEMARAYDLLGGPLARFVLAGSGDRHLLLFTAHHLVFDGMSKEILVRELAAGYAGADLPELGAAEVAPEQLAAAREFWRTRWRGPGEAALPGLVRAPVAAEPGATVEVRLDEGMRWRLADGAADLGATRFEVLLGAVLAVLHRYGNVELPVAVDLSTRTATTADHIGHFVNELPVTVPAAAGDLSFRELVEELRGRLRELYRHRPVPLARAAGGLRPRPALTDVTVSYRRGAATPDFPGLSAKVDWLVSHGTARNALHIQIVDLHDEVVLSLRYSPSALEDGAADRIGKHLRALLAGALVEPDAPIDDLPLVPLVELRRVVREGHGPDVGYPPDATLVSLFAAQVRSAPDAVAAVGPDGRALSYRELDGLSSALAARLAAAGVRPGDRVAVCLPRDLRMLVALLGVLRAGAAYVPVDPTHPAARRELILGEAGPATVLTESALAELSTVDTGPVTAGPAGPGPDGAAYVMFTSGSTGRPKGVVVPHRALANLLLAMRDALGSGPADVWLGLTSIAFDISIVELFLPLVVGARTVVAPDGAGRDGTGTLALVHGQKVTHLQATPSGWRMLLAGGFGAHGPESVVALAGGEALPPSLARELRARVSRLVNVYGPTETTVWSTMDDLPAEPDRVTIGRPLANTRAYLLDQAGRPVPLGLPGELCLGGAGVADGYLGRPDLTEQRFVPDPFMPGRRMYRTGDLARFLPDGRLAFLGRLDGQVKIRGHRVEPGEIEARLLEHPSVAAAAVLARLTGDSADGEPELVGYVVPVDGDGPDPAALRAHLAATLPAAMVPGAWVLLDRLPLTPNGKLDRAALPPPAATLTDDSVTAALTGDSVTAALTGDSVTAALTDDSVTAAIRDIWVDVLQVEDIGLEDDLFDLGGHSLTITRIMARMSQQLGLEVPLEVFFDTPTISGVVEAVKRRGAG
jgi:amino acid adenylation domain-containing protein